MNTLSVPASKPWYREFWPWFLISLPATAVIAGLTTAWLAFQSADGLVVGDYYKAGLAINQTLARDDTARALALTATLQPDNDTLTLTLTGRLQAYPDLLSLTASRTAPPAGIHPLRLRRRINDARPLPDRLTRPDQRPPP